MAPKKHVFLSYFGDNRKEVAQLRDDLIATISRHVEIDAKVQIGVEHDGCSQRLVADIPLKAARRRKKRSK